MRGLLAAIAAAAFLVAACSGDGAPPTQTPPLQDGQPEASPTSSPPSGGGQSWPPEGGSVEFETIDRGDQSGTALEQPQLFKLATVEEWGEFWSRHTSNLTPAPDLPQVDFPREMVIAVVDQVEPSGGFSLEITDIEDDGGRLVVRASKQAPGPDCFVTDALTQPFHIVRTARTSAMLELAVSDRTYDCG